MMTKIVNKRANVEAYREFKRDESNFVDLCRRGFV